LHAHQIIFSLLLLCTNALLPTRPTTHNSKLDEPIKITPLYAPDPELPNEIMHSEQLRPHFQQEKQSDIFSETEIEEMETVFESSPKEAQCIVNHLEDPAYFPLNENYRSAIFVGEPGSGKTIMAKAIAYKMAQHGWKHKIISSTSLLSKYRNQTAIRLQKELEAIAASNEPTVIVIDELHRLLENSESKYHDTDATATALWTFLDKQKGNNKFFLIGTMNRVHKLPKPYKSRILFDCIDFTLISDSTIKNKTFRKILTSKNTRINEEVTDEFLDKELEKMGPCTARDLQNIAAVICRINGEKTPDAASITMIKETSISQAVSKYIDIKTKMQYDLEDETDEQRQNRYHNENIKLQKLLHKENQDVQEKHFVQ